MTLSELLIQYREEHKLSQRELAGLCGVSNGYISMLEKTKSAHREPIVPNLTTLNKIATSMGMTIDTMFSIIDDMPITVNTKKQPRKESELSKNEKIMLELFRQIPEQDQDMILQMIQAALNSRGLLK